MQESIKELEKILNEQIDIYSDMENKIAQKKEILVKGDLECLKNIDNDIETLVQSINKLEYKRSRLLEINKDLKYKNLSQIAEALPKNEAKSILSTKEKLNKVLTNIKRLNDINAELIIHSIKLVQHTATLIGNTLNPEGSAYNRNGKIYKNNSINSSISSVIHDV